MGCREVHPSWAVATISLGLCPHLWVLGDLGWECREGPGCAPEPQRILRVPASPLLALLQHRWGSPRIYSLLAGSFSELWLDQVLLCPLLGTPDVGCDAGQHFPQRP